MARSYITTREFHTFLEENNMQLKKIYEFLLREQGEEIVEFPNDNLAVTLFPGEKKLLFTPQQHTSITKNIQSYVDMIQERFLVLKVNNKGEGIIEVELDPREDFQAVSDFLQQEAQREVG